MAAGVDLSLDFKIDLDWVSLSIGEGLLGFFSKFSSVLSLVLSITFWWGHVWNISWMWLLESKMFFVTSWSILLISGEIGLVVLIEVPGMVSNDVWDNFRVGLNSVVVHFGGLSHVLRILSLVGLSETWENLVTRWVLGLMIPSMLAGLVELIFIPGMVSLVVWLDGGVRVLAWVGSDSGILLDERWGNLVSRWVLGLMVPSLLVGLIMLIIVPSMLSLEVWENFRVRILTWVGGSGSLNETWKNLVTGWVLGLMIPLGLTGHVELIFIPGVLSLAVWGDLGMRIFGWISSLLSESWENLISSWVLGLVIPLGLTGHIELILIPSVLSLIVWLDGGVRVLTWIGGFLNEAWEHLITRWVFGFVIPSMLAGLIEFIFVPRVISLVVWLDGRMGILTWVGLAILLGESWEDLIT